MQSGQTITEFLTDSAIDRAHEVLSDQRSFTLDAATWDSFVARLDEPAHLDPRAAALFARPQRIAR